MSLEAGSCARDNPRATMRHSGNAAENENQTVSVITEMSRMFVYHLDGGGGLDMDGALGSLAGNKTRGLIVELAV